MKPRTSTRKSLRRAFTFRRMVLAAAVVAALGATGLGGYVYYRNNSTTQLAARANIALDQHDPVRAAEYIQRALARHSTGETGMGLKVLMARALIDQEREAEARDYLQQVLAEKPDHLDALDMLARSYVSPTFAVVRHAPKPIADTSAADIIKTIDQGLKGLDTLPATGRNLVAKGELHHMYYLVLQDQSNQASARVDAARIDTNEAAATAAARQAELARAPANEHLEKAIANLREALKVEPANTAAAGELAQYYYEQKRYAEAIALYDQVAKLDLPAAMSEDVPLSAARAMIADESRQPDKSKRLADAQKILESFLKDHPKSIRIMVSLGDVLLDQDHIEDALKLGERAAADAPGELYAQILLVNCRMREKKFDEALKLIDPMTASFGHRPEVWYLQGTANMDAGDPVAAENAFKKALAVSTMYTPAREALLALQIRTGNTEGAALTAAQVLRENRYDMTAWDVTVEGMRKRGQLDRARQLLTNLARESQLPSEARPELIRLLSTYGAPQEARQLLAAMPADDKETVKLRAMVAAASGSVAEARTLMAQALAAAPDDVDLRLKFVDLLAGAGFAADVRAQLDQVSASAIKKALTADQILSLTRGYLRIRLPAQALASVKPMIEKQPQNLEARGLQQQAQQMLAGGTPATGAAPEVDLAQASVADLAPLADAALSRKNFQDALAIARAGLNKDRANAPLHQVAARALAGLGQLDQAVEEAIEAARAEPNRADAYITFVDLFPTPDAAIKGIGFGSRLDPINQAFSNWAMGRLAETGGQPDLALRYYQRGLEVSTTLVDSQPAKDQLYQSTLNALASKKDTAALKKSADTLANSDSVFAAGIRLMASDKLLSLGDRDGAAQQLDKLSGSLSKTAPARLVLAIAARYNTLGQSDRARALLEKQVAATPNDPALLDAYATLLAQSQNTDKALDIRNQIVKLDPGNPEYRVSLAQAQAILGDYPAAFATLDATAALGPTGQQLAAALRVRMLISLGLLNEATQALQAKSAAPGQDDFASLLAVAQAWSQLGKSDEARKAAAAIPSYAGEFGPAQLLLSALDLEAGKPQAAVDALSALLRNSPGGAAQITPQLFVAYLRANNPGAAIELANQQRQMQPENSPAWKTWTTLAATAAREGKQFDQGIALLNALDPESKKAAALDIALLQLLQNKPADANATAASLSDDAPLFNRTTLALLSGQTAAPASANKIFAAGIPSTVIAALAALPADQRPAALAQLATNPNLLKSDIDTLFAETAGDTAKLRAIALAQRLLEAGWSTSALDVLASVADKPAAIQFAAVARHKALTDLRRTAEAEAVVAALADRAKNPLDLAPSVRILLASAWSKQDKNTEALAILEPLAALQRADLLTTLATLHEKLGQFDAAIALHRQVRSLDANNLAAANNLAYLLVAAHPNDKAALAEAHSLIESAIEKAPQITAFQDTLGWIQILSGQAAEGTRRIAAAAPALRLDPAVHYHLGMGYLKTGQTDLARLHLQNVAALAKDRKNVPELQQATEALRTLAAAP